MTKKLSPYDRSALSLATLFGAGYTPVCPGTAASAIAVVVFFLIRNPNLFLGFTIISFIVAFLVSGRAEKIIGEKDSKYIVIDDFSGMLLTLLFIPHQARFVVPAFFLFRALDMVKIPPADSIEKLPGSKAIVGDDLIAGLYASVILQIVRFIIYSLS